MIVVDASTLVGAVIRPRNTPYLAVAAVRRTDRVALSGPVRDEIWDVLNRPRLSRFIDPILRADLLQFLESQTVRFQPSVTVIGCCDPKDNKYLELALASSAHTIISSDNDLLVLHPWRGVRILSPAQYLAAPLA